MNIIVMVRVATTITQRDYIDEGHKERVKFVGQKGRIVKAHSGHGLCYDVDFGGKLPPMTLMNSP